MAPRAPWLPVVALVAACASGLAAQKVPSKPRYRIEYATYFGGKAWDQAREATSRQVVFSDLRRTTSSMSTTSFALTAGTFFSPAFD